jgi:hypothetical protein
MMLSRRALALSSARRGLSTAVSTASKIVDGAKSGGVIVQNGAETEVGQEVIRLATTKGVTTVNILSPNAVNYTETAASLKAMGGLVVVDEKFANSWMFAEVLSELPAATVGASCTAGAGATAVARSLVSGATLFTHGDAAPKELVYGGSSRSPVSFNAFANKRQIKMASA